MSLSLTLVRKFLSLDYPINFRNLLTGRGLLMAQRWFFPVNRADKLKMLSDTQFLIMVY